MRLQAFRFGQPYALWGTNKQHLQLELERTYKRPWWWLRIVGWKIKEAQDAIVYVDWSDQ